MRPVSIIGCGYTGQRLAQRWRERGAAVQGLATQAASLAAIRASGAVATPLDLDRDVAPLDLDGTITYYSVPPASTGVADGRLARCLAAIRGAPWRIIYLSTTGVYGDHAGAEVDEDTPVSPLSPRAARRVAAEQALVAWADSRGVPWCILRIAGIYGPGRLPLERLQRGEPVIAAAEAGPGNRIHVDDLVQACVAAGTAAQAARRIYNVCDGSHDSMTAWLQRVARLAGLPAPPQLPRADAERMLPASMWSFLAESRRVSNRRLIGELGVTLRHANPDDGIRASLAGD